MNELKDAHARINTLLGRKDEFVDLMGPDRAINAMLLKQAEGLRDLLLRGVKENPDRRVPISPERHAAIMAWMLKQRRSQ